MRRREFALAPLASPLHNGSMVEKHPYSIRLETNSDGPSRRYCWSIYEGGKLLANSAHSFATKREATAEAERRAQIMADNSWGKR